MMLKTPAVTERLPVAPPVDGIALNVNVPDAAVEDSAAMVIVPVPPKIFAVHVTPGPIVRTAFAALGKVPIVNAPGPATDKASPIDRVGLEPSAPPIDRIPFA